MKKHTQPEETKLGDTDKSLNIITELKYVTDRKNHKTMTKKINGTEKELIVDTGSLVLILPPDKELIENKQ